MCYIDAPAESGGVIVLWSIVWDRYACIQSYMGCHLLIYHANERLNMFRAPLFPSSGAHDDSVGYHKGRLVLELLLVGGKVQVGWMNVRTEGCNSYYRLRGGHSFNPGRT